MIREGKLFCSSASFFLSSFYLQMCLKEDSSSRKRVCDRKRRETFQNHLQLSWFMSSLSVCLLFLLYFPVQTMRSDICFPSTHTSCSTVYSKYFTSRWCMRLVSLSCNIFFCCKLNDFWNQDETLQTFWPLMLISNRKVLFMLFSIKKCATLLSGDSSESLTSWDILSNCERICFPDDQSGSWDSHSQYDDTRGGEGKEAGKEFFVHWLKRDENDVSCGSWVPTGT